MKNLSAFTFTILLALTAFVTSANAQSDDNRTKIQMTVNYGGKSIVTDLNGVGTSLSRNEDGAGLTAGKDSVKQKNTGCYGGFYITLDAKKISDELLKLLGKKQIRWHHYRGGYLWQKPTPHHQI